MAIAQINRTVQHQDFVRVIDQTASGLGMQLNGLYLFGQNGQEYSIEFYNSQDCEQPIDNRSSIMKIFKIQGERKLVLERICSLGVEEKHDIRLHEEDQFAKTLFNQYALLPELI
jgi:hypothetical protein